MYKLNYIFMLPLIMLFWIYSPVTANENKLVVIGEYSVSQYSLKGSYLGSFTIIASYDDHGQEAPYWDSELELINQSGVQDVLQLNRINSLYVTSSQVRNSMFDLIIVRYANLGLAVYRVSEDNKLEELANIVGCTEGHIALFDLDEDGSIELVCQAQDIYYYESTIRGRSLADYKPDSEIEGLLVMMNIVDDSELVRYYTTIPVSLSNQVH